MNTLCNYMDRGTLYNFIRFWCDSEGAGKTGTAGVDGLILKRILLDIHLGGEIV